MRGTQMKSRWGGAAGILGLGALVLPDMVAVGGAATAFGEDGSLTNERTRDFLDVVVKKLIDAAERLS